MGFYQSSVDEYHRQRTNDVLRDIALDLNLDTTTEENEDYDSWVEIQVDGYQITADWCNYDDQSEDDVRLELVRDRTYHFITTDKWEAADAVKRFLSTQETIK